MFCSKRNVEFYILPLRRDGRLWDVALFCVCALGAMRKPLRIFKVYVWDFLIKKRCFFFCKLPWCRDETGWWRCVVLDLRFWRKCKPVWIFKVFVRRLDHNKACRFYINYRGAEMKRRGGVSMFCVCADWQKSLLFVLVNQGDFCKLLLRRNARSCMMFRFTSALWNIRLRL